MPCEVRLEGSESRHDHEPSGWGGTGKYLVRSWAHRRKDEGEKGKSGILYQPGMSRTMDQGRGTYVLGPVRFCHASFNLSFFLTARHPCGREWVWCEHNLRSSTLKPKPQSPIVHSEGTRRSHDQGR